MSNNGAEEGIAMLALIVFAVIILLMVAAVGHPYQQTWYGRWDPRR